MKKDKLILGQDISATFPKIELCELNQQSDPRLL